MQGATKAFSSRHPIGLGARAAEVEWVNAYHADVRAQLAPLLEGEAAERKTPLRTSSRGLTLSFRHDLWRRLPRANCYGLFCRGRVRPARPCRSPWLWPVRDVSTARATFVVARPFQGAVAAAALYKPPRGVDILLLDLILFGRAALGLIGLRRGVARRAASSSSSWTSFWPIALRFFAQQLRRRSLRRRLLFSAPPRPFGFISRHSRTSDGNVVKVGAWPPPHAALLVEGPERIRDRSKATALNIVDNPAP